MFFFFNCLDFYVRFHYRKVLALNNVLLFSFIILRRSSIFGVGRCLGRLGLGRPTPPARLLPPGAPPAALVRSLPFPGVHLGAGSSRLARRWPSAGGRRPAVARRVNPRGGASHAPRRPRRLFRTELFVCEWIVQIKFKFSCDEPPEDGLIVPLYEIWSCKRITTPVIRFICSASASLVPVFKFF